MKIEGLKVHSLVKCQSSIELRVKIHIPTLEILTGNVSLENFFIVIHCMTIEKKCNQGKKCV